jgi:ABC-type nitrate/sulfonate/bicarbonate transport system substrate-binding protein
MLPPSLTLLAVRVLSKTPHACFAAVPNSPVATAGCQVGGSSALPFGMPETGRPWHVSMAGSADNVENHPVATKRVVRAILKAADLCATDPARARTLVDGGFNPR